MPERKIPTPIYNADDFGISHGVNTAICRAAQEGVLNSTSLMITLPYALEAVKLIPELGTDFAVGLHINLTNEYPASTPEKIPLLVNRTGKFKNGFLKLFCLSIFRRRELMRQAELEITSQIEKARTAGVTLSHLDSHRHIHMIPVLFKTVKKLASLYNIQRVRIVNESLSATIRQGHSWRFLIDGGVIKYFVLKLLYYFNRDKSKTYFYSILYTGKITAEKMNNFPLPSGFDTVEFGLHPGLPELDEADRESIFDTNVLSIERQKEFEALLKLKETSTDE